jgi:hypothetical protein
MMPTDNLIACEPVLQQDAVRIDGIGLLAITIEDIGSGIIKS